MMGGAAIGVAHDRLRQGPSISRPTRTLGVMVMTGHRDRCWNVLRLAISPEPSAEERDAVVAALTVLLADRGRPPRCRRPSSPLPVGPRRPD